MLLKHIKSSERFSEANWSNISKVSKFKADLKQILKWIWKALEVNLWISKQKNKLSLQLFKINLRNLKTIELKTGWLNIIKIAEANCWRNSILKANGFPSNLTGKKLKTTLKTIAYTNTGLVASKKLYVCQPQAKIQSNYFSEHFWITLNKLKLIGFKWSQ